MQNVVIGFLGTTLDVGKRRPWRPSVQLCQQPGFPVDRFELLHAGIHAPMARGVAAAIREVSPGTEVRLVRMDLTNPWDFQEVFGKLYDFAAAYGFDEDRERYHIHLTTGTHVAQICWFLLAESRHVPARLVQSNPPREGGPAQGTHDIIDLDLGRYNALQRRFEAAAREHSHLLRGGIETRSPTLKALIERLELIATTTDAPILLSGEPGTGKSALAARIYELKLQRRRLKGRLVHLPGASLRGTGAMAMLFGQRRAATGIAGSERGGLLREADGGMLHLDGLEMLTLEDQALILHVLESGRYLPLGSDSEVTVRLQFLASCTGDPAQLLRAGRLHPGLMAHLALWSLHLPPLRARREDLEAELAHEMEAAERSLGQKIGFNQDAMAHWLRFARDPAAAWPGNLRDLSASVRRLCTLAERGRITLAMAEEECARLSDQWAAGRIDGDLSLLAEVLADPASIDEFERAQLAAVIRACRESASLSAAGRRLFSVSREEKASRNDADRLRKYLARFGLRFEDLQGARSAARASSPG